MSVSVLKTASSRAFKATLASPLQLFAMNSRASSSIVIFNPLYPLGLVSALLIISFMSLGSRGLSSNTTDLDISALFTSKYGFSVVAPINMITPSST